MTPKIRMYQSSEHDTPGEAVKAAVKVANQAVEVDGLDVVSVSHSVVEIKVQETVPHRNRLGGGTPTSREATKFNATVVLAAVVRDRG